MDSNHMNEHFMDSDKPKFKIPEYDPQTGEPNPYYEEMTGNKLPQYNINKSEVVPETEMDKLNRFLLNVAHSNVGYRRKLLMVKKFIDIATGEKED